MSKKVDRLIALYQSNPPTTYREIAKLRRAVWEVYPARKQEQLTEKHSKRYYFPEPQLAGLNSPKGYNSDVVYRAELAGLAVSPCFDALDDPDMPGYIAMKALSAVRKVLKKDRSLDVAAWLTSVIDEYRLTGKQPGEDAAKAKTSQKASPAAAVPPPTPTPAPAADARQSALPPLDVAPPLPPLGEPAPPVLGERHDELVETAMRNYRCSAWDYIRYCIGFTSEAIGLTQMVEKAPDVFAALPRTAPPRPPVAAKPPVIKATPSVKPAKAKATPAVKAVPTAKKPSKYAPHKDGKPPLHTRLWIVMGMDEVTIPQAIERLRARDASWLPESTDLNAYISLALSTHKETFERVRRGVYVARHPDISENPFAAAQVMNGSNARSQPSQ